MPKFLLCTQLPILCGQYRLLALQKGACSWRPAEKFDLRNKDTQRKAYQKYDGGGEKKGQ